MGKTKIIISTHSGFCFGVKRALNIAEGALKERKEIYSLGPIIHNPEVVKDFSKRGLKIADDINKARSKKATLLIPSHGISPGIMNTKGVSFIDTTCPLVGNVQKIVSQLKNKGYFIIIVGDKDHPEVKGLLGIAGKNSYVVNNRKAASRLKINGGKAAIISQTTAALSNFKEILSEIAKKDLTELVSYNTICKNTIDRQKEASDIAKRVEAMIVIGGKNSANTTRLAEICKDINPDTYHIESEKNLDLEALRKKKKIGIVTGASTPIDAIDKVVEKIRRNDR